MIHGTMRGEVRVDDVQHPPVILLFHACQPAWPNTYALVMHGISVFAVLSRNHLSQSSSSEARLPS